MSDGGDTPKKFMDNVAKLGMNVIVITNHDVLLPDKIEVDGVMVDRVFHADKKGIKFLSGIEFSCETQVEDVHIVVFGCDYTNPKIREMNEKIIESNIFSYQRLLDFLADHGYPMTWDEVLNYGDVPRKSEDVQKKLIFNLMADKNYTKMCSDAKLMVINEPRLSVKREKPEPTER